MSVLERLLAKIRVDPSTECWEWTASKINWGYGQIRIDGKGKLAHRVSYELHCGEIPRDALVCHRCDNPGCINPEHLFLGTDADNMADRDAKGRQARRLGVTNGRSRLTENDIIAIRSATGIRQVDLAKQYGVTQTQISRVRRGEHWNHLG